MNKPFKIDQFINETIKLLDPYINLNNVLKLNHNSIQLNDQKLEIKGKNVTWTFNGKTVTSKIERVVKVDVGGLNDYSEERYAVLIDFEFAGSSYKNVEFLLDDREDRSPVLLNRKTMRMLNVMVNPQRKYIVTTKYVLDN